MSNLIALHFESFRLKSVREDVASLEANLKEFRLKIIRVS